MSVESRASRSDYTLLQSEFDKLKTEVTRTMYPEVIEVVNASLERTYPHYYGLTIPVLRTTDILIIPSRRVLQFQEAATTVHPQRIAILDSEPIVAKYMQRKSTKDTSAMNQVPEVPGKPIIYIEEELKVHDPDIAKVSAVRTLLHEQIHRTTLLEEPFAVEPKSPLFYMAFANESNFRDTITQTDPLAARGAGNIFRALADFAAQNEPQMVIEGARIILSCKNGDQQMRIADAGIDINEGLAEILSYVALETQGWDLMKGWMPQEKLMKLRQIMRRMLAENADYKVQNTIPVIPTYLSKLGLDTDTVIPALAQNQIPLLHARKQSKHPYFS
jgi:hypothetical protein